MVPLLFLIYINDLPEKLPSNVKLFADDSSLFSVVSDVKNLLLIKNNAPKMIGGWAGHWKMSFNPDPSKQAQEVIFRKKAKKLIIFH